MNEMGHATCAFNPSMPLGRDAGAFVLLLSLSVDGHNITTTARTQPRRGPSVPKFPGARPLTSRS